MKAKLIFNVVVTNLLILVALLFLPACFFGVYKWMKLSSRPPLPSDDLRTHPAYAFSDDLKKAQGLSKDKELGTTYKSFIGWRRRPFTGQYKNVAAPYGTRVSTLSSLDESTWFFGGSTMWGTGAIDSETIPSWFSRKTNSHVFNLGETGWVSRQSLNQMINLLGDGYKPRAVVFYDGVNDVLRGCIAGKNNQLPSHMQDSFINTRLNISASDVVLNSFAPVVNFVTAPYKAVLAKVGVEVSRPLSQGKMDCSSNPAKAKRVASHLLANWYSAYLLSEANGAEFLGVLQPQVFSSNVPKNYLHPADDYLSYEFSAVYPIVKQMIQASCSYDRSFCSRLIDGTDWLDGNNPVYIDFCHITGSGNFMVAGQIAKILSANDSHVIP